MFPPSLYNSYVIEYNTNVLLLGSQLTNTPVMSLQSGSALGAVGEPIIDPRKLQVVAYYVLGPRISETSIVHTSDIREYGPLGFIVDGADSVMALDEDLVRLQEVIKFKFSLLGKSVVDDTKKKLGKVADYALESDSYNIQKIHVNQSVIKNFSNANLIIHRSQIIEVTDSTILVRSATIPDQVGLAQAINPFRKTPHLAPDSTSVEHQQ